MISLLKNLLLLLIIYLPGKSGNKLRYIYYRTRLKKIGKNVLIDTGVSIQGARHISIGDNVHIDKNCIISTGTDISGKTYSRSKNNSNLSRGEIVIGNNIHIAQFCMILGYGGVYIGDNTGLSSGTKLYSLTNLECDPQDRSKITSILPLKDSLFMIGSIILDSNVWLGLNCIVMPNVQIGKNSFAASNSLIISSFNENSYIAGNPAKFIKNRFKL